MQVLEIYMPFEAKMKEELAAIGEFPHSIEQLLTRLDGVITLATLAKKTLSKKKQEGVNELADMDRQLNTLKGVKGVPGTDAVIDALLEKREALRVSLGLSGAAETGETMKVKPVEDKPATGGAAAPTEDKPKPKRVVPCNKGASCPYGFNCTFRHTKEELEGFKARGKKPAAQGGAGKLRIADAE